MLTAIVRPIIVTAKGRMSASEYIATGTGSLADLSSTKALDVVRSSVWGLDYRDVRFNEDELVYHILFDSVALEDLEFAYGDAAADTWMEGDINISDGEAYHELHLELVSVDV